MNMFGALFIFALYVFFAATLAIWRHAEAWGGMPISRRLLLGVSTTWKWWLIFSIALLCFDAGTHYGRGVPGDMLVIVIAIIMAVVFAMRRSAESRGSQFNKKK